MHVLSFGCAHPAPTHVGMPPDATAAEIAEAERLTKLSLDSWIEQLVRVQLISQRLRIAGKDLCGPEIAPVLGAAIVDVDGITPELRSLAVEQIGRHGKLHVVEVFHGMAAERAGLVRGDSIRSAGGIAVRRLRGLARTIDSREESIELEVDRDGQTLKLDLPVELGCSYVASLVSSYWGADNVNAELWGRSVVIHAALARELSKDEELAMVIGHEIAHGILRQEIGRRFGPEVEHRADHLGCYLAARSGYRIPSEVKLFEILVRDLNMLADDGGGTHPATHARILALRNTRDEIERKRGSGEPLLPDSW